MGFFNNYLVQVLFISFISRSHATRRLFSARRTSATRDLADKTCLGMEYTYENNVGNTHNGKANMMQYRRTNVCSGTLTGFKVWTGITVAGCGDGGQSSKGANCGLDYAVHVADSSSGVIMDSQTGVFGATPSKQAEQTITFASAMNVCAENTLIIEAFGAISLRTEDDDQSGGDQLWGSATSPVKNQLTSLTSLSDLEPPTLYYNASILLNYDAFSECTSAPTSPTSSPTSSPTPNYDCNDNHRYKCKVNGMSKANGCVWAGDPFKKYRHFPVKKKRLFGICLNAAQGETAEDVFGTMANRCGSAKRFACRNKKNYRKRCYWAGKRIGGVCKEKL